MVFGLTGDAETYVAELSREILLALYCSRLHCRLPLRKSKVDPLMKLLANLILWLSIWTTAHLLALATLCFGIVRK